MIVSSDYLNEVAGVSSAEGLRWQKVLYEDGLLGHGPLLRSRLQLVQLTEKGKDLLEVYLRRRLEASPEDGPGP